MLNPQELLETIGRIICDLVFHHANWRFIVCFFAGIGLAFVIGVMLPPTPLRWILAGGAVLLGIFVGNRWNRGVS